MAIRRATLADLPRIWEIRHGVAENRLTDPTSVSDGEVRWYLDHGIFLASDVGEDVKGFGCANPLIGYVWALFVDPAAQGQGHGSALLAAMEQACRAAGRAEMHLTTGADTAAADFYRRRGWRDSGTAFSGERVFVKVIAR